MPELIPAVILRQIVTEQKQNYKPEKSFSSYINEQERGEQSNQEIRKFSKEESDQVIQKQITELESFHLQVNISESTDSVISNNGNYNLPVEPALSNVKPSEIVLRSLGGIIVGDELDPVCFIQEGKVVGRLEDIQADNALPFVNEVIQTDNALPFVNEVIQADNASPAVNEVIQADNASPAVNEVIPADNASPSVNEVMQKNGVSSSVNEVVREDKVSFLVNKATQADNAPPPVGEEVKTDRFLASVNEVIQTDSSQFSVNEVIQDNKASLFVQDDINSEETFISTGITEVNNLIELSSNSREPVSTNRHFTEITSSQYVYSELYMFRNQANGHLDQKVIKSEFNKPPQIDKNGGRNYLLNKELILEKMSGPDKNINLDMTLTRELMSSIVNLKSVSSKNYNSERIGKLAPLISTELKRIDPLLKRNLSFIEGVNGEVKIYLRDYGQAVDKLIIELLPLLSLLQNNKETAIQVIINGSDVTDSVLKQMKKGGINAG